MSITNKNMLEHLCIKLKSITNENILQPLCNKLKSITNGYSLFCSNKINLKPHFFYIHKFSNLPSDYLSNKTTALAGLKQIKHR